MAETDASDDVAPAYEGRCKASAYEVDSVGGCLRLFCNDFLTSNSQIAYLEVHILTPDEKLVLDQ